MIILDDEPVASGRQHPITHVDGRPPQTLGDFTGDVCITLIHNERPVQMLGAGCPAAATAVRFHQKHPHQDDKDVRVWTITQSTDGTFLATPAATF